MRRSRVIEPEATPKAEGPGPPLDDVLMSVRPVRTGAAMADPPVTPRCPVCRYPLVARMTCLGPRFPCACGP